MPHLPSRSNTGRGNRIRFPDAIVPGFDVTFVGGFHSPDFDFRDRGGGAAGAGIETARSPPVHVRCHDGLAIVGKDFDQVLVDEDAQLHILPRGQIGDGEGCFGTADAECAAVRLQVDGQAFVFLIGKESECESVLLGLSAINRDSDLEGVAVEVRETLRGFTACRPRCRRNIDVFVGNESVSQRLQFAQGLYAQTTVVTQAQLARQGLNRFPAQRVVKGRQPSPHDSPAIGSEHTFRSENVARLVR